ncbi:MAG TPA: glycoside hydrolase family 9 protein [Vicinamibacteria bacterium]|jgi:endoglucanase|nr:glycoside hydrolase family 9 protein [Vicinamibacteria bacterium]
MVEGTGACRQKRPDALDQGGADQITLSVKLDNFGYRPDDTKVAVFSADPGSIVQVRTSEGTVALAVPTDGGSISSRGTDAASGDQVWWVDFSPLHAGGSYHLFSASLNARSYDFVIAPNVYKNVMRTALKTFYRQRCGTAKPPIYAGPWADGRACHRADVSTGPAKGQVDRGLRDLTGGWHDAGDYNKYLTYSASNAILFMLRAREDGPSVFPDGDLNIPESGNGLPDLLDEVKWELDFFLKMQLPDGSVLSSVHADGAANGASPPSVDTTPRYYRDPTLESGAVFAGSCAFASRVFTAAGQVAYGSTLRRAALLTWGWLQGQGNSDEKVWAAAEVFRLDPTIASARNYVDGYHPAHWLGAVLGVTRYDSHAAITYVQTRGATPAVVSAMGADLARQVDQIFSADDLYRNGMPTSSYHWGSNEIRAGQGVFLLQAARLGLTGSHTAGECRGHALDLLHFFHGQNPLSMVYLTNMSSEGGEHSSWQFFHNWFGQSQSPYSRSNYVGKPASVVEPHYPYFRGLDNHGIRDDKTSALGPAPGFVPGGPNMDYAGDATPPGGGTYPNRFYRDWNEQAVWTARTWEITENSIGYQGPYVALAAAFVTP